ncbi:hypothetical protein PN478_02175 [Dolichospermum circinale CS-534/05]|uniref:hypothetical protein n=1 Tax=Dolichospermum circinale TaxID=109265 RepID=UPI00232E2AE9|nr:hypothetical protein [Dolichospermum circinale]MDB9489338.1 hypothetical protein [Dolichospermum circinale CS-534/05]
MERLYHGNVSTTETSLPRKRLYHGNVSTTKTSLQRKRLYHGQPDLLGRTFKSFQHFPENR